MSTHPTSQQVSQLSYEELLAQHSAARKEGEEITPELSQALRLAWLLRDPGPCVPVEDDDIAFLRERRAVMTKEQVCVWTQEYFADTTPVVEQLRHEPEEERWI